MNEAKAGMAIPNGWTLSQQEISNGIYQVRLTAYFGTIIDMTGTDIDDLMARCIESANSINKQPGYQ
jgi:hypothetical protein